MTASSFDLEKKANDRGKQKRGLRCVTRWNGLVVVGLACKVVLRRTGFSGDLRQISSVVFVYWRRAILASWFFLIGLVLAAVQSLMILILK